MRHAGSQHDLLLQPVSAVRHASADTADWIATWVCVGFVEQLTEVEAVLPATIGYHATHVRRTAEGLTAAINARPFGGCMSVPVHCGSTRNVTCPHLACAFSADGGVLDSDTDPSGRARAEFVGDGRRTVKLPLAQWGSLLFVNVTLKEPAPLPVAGMDPPESLGPVVIGSQLVSGNWLTAPQRAASAAADVLGTTDAEVTTVAPNLALVRHGAKSFAVLSRPAGPTRSTIVWALNQPGSSSQPDGSQTDVVPLIERRMWAISRRS